ncbi:hypothetical protein GGI35DRAFT_59638 [Trichoderma velutinum]
MYSKTGRWFCVSASVSGTHSPVAFAALSTSESPAITTSCISTTPSNCRSGPAFGSDGASAAPYLYDLISLYGVPRGNNCRCHQCHPGRWLHWAGLGIVAPPFQLLARTTPSIHAAEYVLHILLLIFFSGFW